MIQSLERSVTPHLPNALEGRKIMSVYGREKCKSVNHAPAIALK